MPGPKAGPQLYVPDVPHSPTTQAEGPTAGSPPPPPILSPDQLHVFSQSLHCVGFMFTSLQEIQLALAEISHEP